MVTRDLAAPKVANVAQSDGVSPVFLKSLARIIAALTNLFNGSLNEFQLLTDQDRHSLYPSTGEVAKRNHRTKQHKYVVHGSEIVGNGDITLSDESKWPWLGFIEQCYQENQESYAVPNLEKAIQAPHSSLSQDYRFV